MINEKKLDELLNSVEFKNNKVEHTIGYAYEKLLLGISDEDNRLELMDYLKDKISRFTMIYIIIRINDNEKRIRVFDKYIDMFSSQELMQMLLSLDEDKQEEFIDTHIKYFNEHNLYLIWSGTYKMHYMGVNRDKLLDKYIDKFDQISLSLLLINLISYECDFESAIKYLLGKTSNDTTIKNIYQAALTINPNYVISEKKSK